MQLSRSFVHTAFISLLAFGAVRADERPNIIVILMDDMGYNDVGARTYPAAPNQYPNSGPAPNFGANTDPDIPQPNKAQFLTPQIDSLAAQGMQMTSFYTSRLCSPSRASLLCGRYDRRVNITDVFFPTYNTGMSTREVTLPEMLREAGYRTGMVGKWHLGYNPTAAEPFQMMPTRHGFQEFLGTPHSNDMTGYSLIRNETVLNPDMNTAVEQSEITWRYTEAALDFIDRSSASGHPFFLYLAHSMTHIPCWPSDREFTNTDGTTWPQFLGSSGVSYYYDVVKETDHSVGRILAKLTQAGISDNTIVIFTSDNGPWLSLSNINLTDRSVGSAYPLKDGKKTTVDGGVRVPFLVRWPGHISPGTSSSQPGSLTDLLPTLAGIAGAGVPTDRTIDGKDLMPLWSGSVPSINRSIPLYDDTVLSAVIKGNWKLRNGALYDLSIDIQELNNLAGNPAYAATLADLQAEQSSISASISSENEPRGSFTSWEIELDSNDLNVPEGGTATLQVRLSANPGSAVTVSTTHFSGDSNLSVSAGGSLNFDSGNWSDWQTVTLAAASDADALHGGATFRLTNSAANVVRELFAFELDDEAPLPVSVTRVWPKLQAVGLANTTVKLVGEVDADFGGPTNPPGTVYSWQKVSGPGTVTFSEPAARETSATFSLNGVYRIRMIANHPDAGGPGVDEFDVYVGIAPPPVNGVESSAVLSYDATADTDGDSNWENLITPGAGDWALTSSITRTASDPAPSVSFIDAAWNFLGGITGAGGTSSNLNAYSTGDASFEIWFKPASLPTSAQQVIWESGGDIGTSFVLNGSTLSFVVDDSSGNAANGAIASATLAPLPANGGFVHAVGVISLADDEIRLYLDGSLADTEAIPAVTDWCGTSASGLGKVDDTPIAGPPVTSATVDFDPTGELAAQFTISGSAYTESATGGLDGSVGVNLANLNPSNFTGSQSVSYATGAFTVGNQFTIGTYFKLTTLPTAAGQFLRLGLTGGGTTNFGNRGMSAIDFTGASGAAKFVINNGSGTQPTATFTLSAGQWYYFQTAITRVELTGTNESTQNDFALYLSDSSGNLGSLVSSDSATNSDGFTKDAQMNDVQFAGFKGSAAATGTGTVIDKFHVVAGAPGGTSTVNFNSLGGNDLLTQPIEEFAGQIAIFRFYDQTLNTTQISDLAGGPDLANIGPMVSAGADVSGACGAPIALGGSASDDGKPIPATLTSLWRQLSGPDAATPFPAQASFANASAPTTSATFGVPGSYTLRLEADDGEIKVCDDAFATITSLTYASWAAGIAFPPGQGDPDDNPDHDRFVNLWEWALGYDPLTPHPTASWFHYSTETSGANRVITLQVDVRRDRQPVILFEESFNLQSWHLLPATIVTPVSGIMSRWTLTREVPAGVPRLFLRARVSE